MPRRLQEVEVYQSLYYQSRIKPAFNDHIGSTTLSSGQHLAQRKKFATAMYETETAEVKDAVRAKLSELSAALDCAREEEVQDRLSTEHSPEQYQW
jgi:hypothetical protein